MFGKHMHEEMLARQLERKVDIRLLEDAVLPYHEGLGQEDAEAALRAAREHREGEGK